LKDLVVVVTGSGKGLGKGIAESCYAEGAKVVTWDRSGAAKAVADALDPSGKRTLYVQADTVNEAQVVEAFDEVVKKFGRVDVLVNNAGISRHRPIEELTLELFEEVMKINVTGVFLCCKSVVPIMK
jgi:3-oxoacyl-[acyl-carrier protein] reductase